MEKRALLSPSKLAQDIKIDYSVPITKIYCEDDYFDEAKSEKYHLKCDHTIQVPEPPLAFNYNRFNDYLKIKSQVECFNRSVQVSRGITPLGLDYWTDERLKEELFGVYGRDLDEKSERFKLLLENYKEQKLNQVREWIENENDDAVTDSSECLNEEIVLLKHFTKEELASFKAVGGKDENFFNPFVLPRKKISEKTDKVVGNKGKSNKKSRGHLVQRNELVAAEVKSILQTHPFGLAQDKLLQICNERLGRKASDTSEMFLNLNSGMIQGYLSKERVVVTRKMFQEEDSLIVFPFGCDPGIDVLWNIKHKLLVILNLSYGIVEINECLELYNKIFQGSNSSFPFHDWGFDSGENFVKWILVDKWSSEVVELIELNNIGGNAKKKYYLAVMTNARRKLLETNSKKESENLNKKSLPNSKDNKSTQRISKNTHVSTPAAQSTSQKHGDTPSSLSPSTTSVWNKNKVSQKQKPHKPPLLNYDPTAISIDSQHVQFGETICQEQNEIKPGEQFKCVVALVNSPTNFYLVRLVKWRMLDKLFLELRDYWFSKPHALSPHPQFLQRNYLCLAKTGEDEVYRVVILGKHDPHHYQVYCIDYGNHFKVRHDQLRYMPKNFLYLLDAQGISCALYNVASVKKNPTTGSDEWSKGVCDYIQKLLSPATDDHPIVTVIFKQRMYGNGKWLVKVSKPPDSLDFGEDVMTFVNKEKN